MTNEEILVQIAIRTWKSVASRLNKLLSSLSEEELQQEVSPGRNRVYYIVGHLAAVHDRLFPLLGLGERLHPELDEIFITNPDRTFPDEISGSDVREALEEINSKLTSAIEALAPAELLKRHEAVSEEDFAKDPLRNRIAVLEQRTTHAMFHAGQVRLVTAT